MPHIPYTESSALTLLSFDEALSASGKSGGYDPEKWIYVPDFYTEYRYLLGTRGDNPLICIGINPSTAAPDFQKIRFQKLHLYFRLYKLLDRAPGK